MTRPEEERAWVREVLVVAMWFGLIVLVNGLIVLGINELLESLGWVRRSQGSSAFRS